MATDKERLASLQQQRATLERRISALRSRISRTERKQDARLKIMAGAVVLKQAEFDLVFREQLLEWLDRSITREADRQMFVAAGFELQLLQPDVADGETASASMKAKGEDPS